MYNLESASHSRSGLEPCSLVYSRSASPSPPASFCIQKMDENHPSVVCCETPPNKVRSKFKWDDITFKEFINACVFEVERGNKPTTSFTKAGWANILQTMNEKTGKTLDKKQMTNKWDSMKKEWKIYDRLMRLETGIGGTRSFIDASPEWWDEKIKEDKDFAKFRGADLSIYELDYATLFRDSVATGENAMTPLQFQKDSNVSGVRSEENIEGKGDSDEISLGDDDGLFPSFVESSSSKRKKSKNVTHKRSTKSKTSSFEDKLDVVLDALSTKSTQTFPPNDASPTIADCMNIVITFPGFEEDSQDYTRALRVLIKKPNREAFMYPTTHAAKMKLLKPNREAFLY
ncbi:putative Myb/SANT-like domain-containing protein [Helianthus annuus]|nr:putative Myb/SANT-like domain-containing protein [Helianthus annuus]